MDSLSKGLGISMNLLKSLLFKTTYTSLMQGIFGASLCDVAVMQHVYCNVYVLKHSSFYLQHKS